MKTKNTLALTLGIIAAIMSFTSCENAEKETSKQTEKKVEPVEEKNSASVSDCISDEQLTAAVAEVMEQTYATTLRDWPDFDGDSSTYNYVDLGEIETLKEQCDSCTGIRVYLGYEDGINIPSSPQLYLVNINECDAVLEDETPVLRIDGEENTFISASDAADKTLNWRNAIAENWEENEEGWLYDSLFAYSFKRSTFPDINNESELMKIKFTMNVNEESESENSGEFGDFRIGLIVASSNEGGETISSVDLAVPCPTHCGESNLLLPN